MTSVADAFGLPFKDPAWVGKIAVQGLILFIPFVGWIAAFGWLMITFDNYRAGRYELAPAGFHLSRGIGIFAVLLIYSLALDIPAIILGAIAGSMTAHEQLSGAGLSGLSNLWSFVVQLVVDFLLPSIVILTYRNGFGGGLDIGKVWALASSNMSNSVIAGLIIFVSGFIGAAGLIACCVGIFFTSIYATAIIAGVVTWFERVQSAPAAPPATPAA